MLSSKFDIITAREWQNSLSGSDLPTLKQFLDFATHRYQVLEATGKLGVNTRSKTNAKTQAACHATLKYKCSYCNGEHSIFRCKDFLSLSIPRRNSEIRSKRLCINCLRSTSHTASKCTSGQCKTCNAKHNTLLHAANGLEARDYDTADKKQAATTEPPSAVVSHTSNVSSSNHVLLSTAIVNIHDSKEKSKVATAAIIASRRELCELRNDMCISNTVRIYR